MVLTVRINEDLSLFSGYLKWLGYLENDDSFHGEN